MNITSIKYKKQMIYGNSWDIHNWNVVLLDSHDAQVG